MALLVKLTNSESSSFDSNQYRCQIDEDVIIPANSTIALQSAHISTGILANYQIGSEDTVGGKQGTKLGDLLLTADQQTAPDRTREILLTSGSYSISGLTTNITNAFNNSLMYTSASSALSTSTNTLVNPTAFDFGTSILCDTNVESLVEIKFNSMPQKETPDFAYANKQDGIDIDANGNITYIQPGGFASLILDPTKADQTNFTVIANQDPSPDFNINDTITLANSQNSAVPYLETQIKDIQPSGENVDSAVVIDPAFANQAGGKITTGVIASLNDIKFKVGDHITADDGAGVLGTPSANTLQADVSAINLKFKNANHLIEDVSPVLGYDILKAGNVVSVAPGATQTQYTLTISAPFADAVDKHLIPNAFFHVNNSQGVAEAIVKILQIGADPATVDNTLISCEVEFINTTPNTADWAEIKTLEYLYSNAKTGADVADLLFDTPDNLMVFNEALQPILSAPLKNKFISVDDEYILEFVEASLVAVDIHGILQTEFKAYKHILGLYTASGVDITKLQTVPTDLVITQADVVLGSLGIVDGDDIVITDFSQAILNQVALAGAPAQSGAKVIIPIDYNTLSLTDLYNFRAGTIGKLIASNAIYIVKDSTDKNAEITMKNITDPTKIPVITRAWPGVFIVASYEITLYKKPGRPTVATQLVNYDLMVKGDRIPTAENALVVEDTKIAPGCGRFCFLLNTAEPCQFGIIPETNNFKSQTPGDNDLSVKVVGSGANAYYQVWRGNQQITKYSGLVAEAGDRVIFQYGVSPADTDYEYNEAVGPTSNRGTIVNNITTWTDQATGQIYEEDRGKILISVLRQGEKNSYFYLGCAKYDIQTNTANQALIGRVIPWTPRTAPYAEPMYFNNGGRLHLFVAPNKASVRMLELTPDASIVITNGVKTYHDFSVILYNPDMHETNNPELSEMANKYTSGLTAFDFKFTDINIQRQLGYRTSENKIVAISGKWQANVKYTASYLPDSLVIIADSLPLPIQSFDCYRTNGSRRSIIAVANNFNAESGEYLIEPNNLYRIKLNNPEFNLRHMSISFETIFGEPIQLKTARACVVLLFESS